MTLEDVRRLYPNIAQPPHRYYDLANRKQSSPFPPGRPSAFYQPFLEHFRERAQTARAQAALEHRKGRRERGNHYAQLAQQWTVAAAVAFARQEKALLAELLETQTRAIDGRKRKR